MTDDETTEHVEPSPVEGPVEGTATGGLRPAPARAPAPGARRRPDPRPDPRPDLRPDLHPDARATVFPAVRARRSAAAIALDRALRRLVDRGTLQVTFADGGTETYGDGTAPRAVARFTSRAAERSVLRDPEMAIGERYTDGGIVVPDEVDGRAGVYAMIERVIRIRLRTRASPTVHALVRAHRALRAVRPANRPARAKRNVERHYDLDRRFYDLFLDADRQYSCAFFARPDMTLEEAQAAKVERLVAKLHARPGMSALDIGSGWGGLGLRMARAGLEVTGATLSAEQLAVARERAADAGLAERARFELADYRNVDGPFDRIVSVGMLEHVGRAHLDAYFAKVTDLLAEDGVALVHTIGNHGPPQRTSPWLTRHIFPGGHVPSLSEIVGAVERAGAMVTDVEVLRGHYAETLAHWRERFAANRDRARELTDERFCRMWEFYLAAAEAGFRVGDTVVFQVQLVKDRNALPRTRDYMGG